MFCSKFFFFSCTLLLSAGLAAQAQSGGLATTITPYGQGYTGQDFPTTALVVYPHAEPLPSGPKGVVHQADELCERIGLPQGEAREKVTRYMFSLLPTESTEQQVVTLAQLLRGHTRDFQRLLAPMLPQPSYDRYVALLDGLTIGAE